MLALVSPSLERGVRTHEKDKVESRYLVKGGFNMGRMAGCLPDNTVSLVKPGWFTAGPSSCGGISQRMAELGPGPGDTVVLALLSNKTSPCNKTSPNKTSPRQNISGSAHVHVHIHVPVRVHLPMPTSTSMSLGRTWADFSS